MDIMQILNVALPVVYVLVGLALIWFLIELVRFLKTTRKTVVDLKKQVDPTLAHVETITASLEPVVARVDPLVERVSLTVDAANLEIMRVDQILENVTDITEGVSSAVDAMDTAANAPMKLVNSASEKVRGVFKARKASDESIALGNKSEDKKAQPLPSANSAVASEAKEGFAGVAAVNASETAAAVSPFSVEDVAAPADAVGATSDVVPEASFEVAKSPEEAKAVSSAAAQEASGNAAAQESGDGYFTYAPAEK